MPMTPLAVYDLREALAAPGCALCRLVARAAARTLTSVLGEYVMDDDVQVRWAASRGLCAGHAGQALALPGNALGLAVLADKAFARLLQDADAASVGGGRSWPWRPNGAGAGVADALAATQTCPACAAQAEAEARLLRLLSDGLAADNDPTLAAYRAAPSALCLPHTQALLHTVPDAARAQIVLQVQQAAWARLHAELGTFIDRNNARHGVFTGYGDEGDSWRRAMLALGGAPDAFARGRTTE